MKPSKTTINKRIREGMTREEAENTPVMTVTQQRRTASRKSPWRGQKIRSFR